MTQAHPDDSAALLALILREFPEFAAQPTPQCGNGKNSQTFIFEDVVFKGSLEDKQIPYIRQECRLLQHLAGEHPLIPKVIHIGQDTAFFGMTRLPGEVLSQNLFMQMTQHQQMALAEDIARFMVEFACSFSDEDARNLIVLTGDYVLKGEPLETALAAPLVRQALGDDFSRVEELLKDYTARLALKRSVAVHDDFHPGNTLVDPLSGKLSGVIDYGNVNICLPEEGFYAWRKPFPEEFTEVLCTTYSQLSGQKVEYRDIQLANLAYRVRFLFKALRTEQAQDAPAALARITELAQWLCKQAPA